MEQVRCTNCGSTAIIPNDSGEFFVCEACGSTFSVARAQAFSKVTLDHTQDIRAWREYLAKQLKLQQDSNKARDYGGVKLFAQKILSVLPDDFCARFYAALADRYGGNDVAYTEFLSASDFSGVTKDELKEVTASVVATVEPKYVDAVKAFVERAYPENKELYSEQIDRNVRLYIQKLRYTKVTDRDVFICHRTAEPDQDVADAVCTRLEERGLRCWIAPRNILAGSQNYERDILMGVENCRVFLLISSFKSIYSDDCEKELKAAVLSGKALYSYKIDDTPYDGAFERAMSAVQWLDATDDPYAHLEQLVIDIMGLLADDERQKAELEEKRLAMREKERVLAEERRARENERLERLERIVGGGLTNAAPTTAHSGKLRRAEIEVQSQNYDKARKLLDEVLDAEPECAHAWWLLMLCEYGVPDDETLAARNIDYTAHRYYKNVERFSDDEPEFALRVSRMNDERRKAAFRGVSDALKRARKYFEADDYLGMKVELKSVETAFSDESSMLFTRFSDLASEYYWLKLWSKYGQNELVCVEDITRETEYRKAVKYASAAQAATYEHACSTIAKNAKNYLRERSKNPANDGKLVEYLVDNKGILPIDVYNYYSSLLYFRKMLSVYNLTETQLENSTVDISTNEYFMLAQSLATDEQRDKYDRLLKRLDENREQKSGNAMTEKIKNGGKSVIENAKDRISHAIQTASLVVLCILDFVFSIVAVTLLDWAYDGGAAVVVFTVFVLVAGIMRAAADAAVLSKKSRGIIAITYINLVLSIASVAAFFTPFVRNAPYALIVI